MDTRFFFTFFIVTLILEIIPIKKVMQQANTYRMTDYSDIDDKVKAMLIKSGSSNDDKTGLEYWGKYEWYYNGKRHRKLFSGSPSDYPYELEITVNRKTGKYKTPEAERRISKMNMLLIVGAFVLGYIITCLIMGYSPLLQ